VDQSPPLDRATCTPNAIVKMPLRIHRSAHAVYCEAIREHWLIPAHSSSVNFSGSSDHVLPNAVPGGPETALPRMSAVRRNPENILALGVLPPRPKPAFAVDGLNASEG
jgi:hypothetical protein